MPLLRRSCDVRCAAPGGYHGWYWISKKPFRANFPGVPVIVDGGNRTRSENQRLILPQALLPIDLVFAAIGHPQGPDVNELTSAKPAAQALLALPRKVQAA